VKPKKILLTLLCVYSLTLIISAWPVTATLWTVNRAQTIASDLLTSILVIPGLKLFYRPFNETFKTRKACIQIKGVSAAGVELLFETRPNCSERPVFRLLADPFETQFHRFMEEAAMDRMYEMPQLGDEVFKSDYEMGSRERAVHQVLGDYFCRSQLVTRRNPDPDAIWVAWYQDQVGYAEGEHRRVYMMLTEWNCTTRSLVQVHWDPYLPQEKVDVFLSDKLGPPQ